MKVFVTGAGGFIGQRVVARLAAAEDLEVVAGRRDGRAVPGATTVAADVTDLAQMTRALDGVDAVVHTAYGDQRVTVDGTRTTLDAAAAAGVTRFVHLSSISVYGGATGVVTESIPLDPNAAGYAAWKIDGDLAVAASPISSVRLRPTIVYGAGCDLWVDHPLRRLRSGRWGTFGDAGEGTCNPVHVDDVAAAVEAALRCDAVGAYNINGDETLTWNAWFRRLASAAGLPEPQDLGRGRVRARSAAAVPLKAIRKAVPGFSPGFLLGVPAASERTLFALQATYAIEAAQADLGWSPRVPLDEGLPAAVEAAR